MKKIYPSIILLISSVAITPPLLAHGNLAGNPNTGSAVIEAKGDIPTPAQYLPTIASYMKTAYQRLDNAEKQLTLLQQALKKGDAESAQQAYIRAHYEYEVVRSVMAVFVQSDRVINDNASYFLTGENDPRFSGFHLVEYQLFAKKDNAAALNAVNDLLQDLHDLKGRVAVETLPLPKLVQAADDNVEQILSIKLAGKENLYSKTDLADMAANLEGSKLITNLLDPFLSQPIKSQLRSRYLAVDEIMAKYHQPQCQTADCYLRYEKLTPADKQLFFSKLTLLAETLSDLRADLKVDVYYKYPH